MGLGLRLVRAGGRAAALRLSLLAFGAAMSCVAVLFVAGMATVTSNQVATEQSAGLRFSAFDGEPATFRATEFREYWQGEQLRRVVVTDVTTSTPAPTGMERLPDPGEVVLSPGLADLVADEAVIAQRFPQEQIGSIDDSGLASPDDLIAYVGVGTDELISGNEIAGFGSSQLGSERDPGATRVVALLLAALILMPIAVFLSTCARLSARSRDQRLATLRLLGLSPRRTQLVNAVEIGIGALIGAAAGAVAFSVWTATARSASIGSYDWFVTDMTPPPAILIATVVLISAAAVVVAAASSQAGITEPLSTRRERAVRSVRARRIVPVVVGIALLAVSWQRADGSPSVASWLPIFVAGMALTAIGLTIAAPFLSIAIGRLLDRVDTGPTMLASGRLRHDPGAGARLVSGLAVSVFALGFAFSVLEAFEFDSESRDSDAELIALTASVPATDAASFESITEITGVSELRRYPPVPEPASNDDVGDPRESGTILVATCDTFGRLSGASSSGCVEGATYRIGTDFNRDGIADDDNNRGQVTPLGYPEPEGTLVVEIGSAIEPSVTFLAPPGLDLPDITGDDATRTSYEQQLGTTWVLSFDADGYDRATAISAVTERFPGSNLSGFRFTVPSPDLPTYRAMVSAGSLAALAIGIMALVVATVDRSLERRRETARLAALGTSKRTLDAAHILHTVPVASTVIGLAAAGSAFGGAAYLRIGGEDTYGVPVSKILLLVAGSLLGIVTATGLGIVALRQSTASSIRDD